MLVRAKILWRWFSSIVSVMTLKQLHAKLLDFVNSPPIKRWFSMAPRVCFVAVLALLSYKLTQIGWSEIWQAVPTSSLFYLLFLANYLLQPLSEEISYRLAWKFAFWQALPAFLKKHVYNLDVVDYAGEFSLYVWATKRLGISDQQAWRTIKDNSIVSLLCGYVVALVMPAICYRMGQLAPGRNFKTHEIMALVAGPLIVCGLLGLVLALKRRIFSLPSHTLWMTGGIHLSRLLLINVLTGLQWWAVMPEQPLYVWCTFLAAQNLIGRLPSILRQDLIFVAAGVELSQGLDAPVAAVAGMLLINHVLTRVVNLVVFSTTLFGRDPAISTTMDQEMMPACDDYPPSSPYKRAA